MTHGFLTQIGDTCLPERFGSFLLQTAVVLGAAMDTQMDGVLLALRDRLAGRLVGTDGDQRCVSRLPRPGRLCEERLVDLFDDLEDGVGLER